MYTPTEPGTLRHRCGSSNGRDLGADGARAGFAWPTAARRSSETVRDAAEAAMGRGAGTGTIVSAPRRRWRSARPRRWKGRGPGYRFCRRPASGRSRLITKTAKRLGGERCNFACEGGSSARSPPDEQRIPNLAMPTYYAGNEGTGRLRAGAVGGGMVDGRFGGGAARPDFDRRQCRLSVSDASVIKERHGDVHREPVSRRASTAVSLPGIERLDATSRRRKDGCAGDGRHC